MKKYVITTMLLFFLMGVNAIPASAKSYVENDISYKVRNKEAEVVGADIKGDELTIPSTLGGFQVTGIGKYAFSGGQWEKVTLPDSVKKIGSHAFRNNEKLKSIRMPANLQYIDSQAFSGCSALTEIKFNNKLKEIEYRAFSECISLKKIALPDSLTAINRMAFESCYKLSSIKFGKKLSRVGEKAFYKNYALKTVRIPSGVKQVEEEAFKKCEDLSEVTFAGSSTKLEEGVFSNCISLKKVVLPKKMKSISENLFYGCKGLKSIKLPESATLLKKRAFFDCGNLQTIKMSKKTYAIGDGTFAYTGLKKITLSPNMQFIGNGAFRGTNLKTISLKSKVTYIGNKVFADCKKLRTIYVASGNKNYSSQDGVLYNKNKTKLIQYPLHKTNKSFRTPSTLNSIRGKAFSGNDYLQNVVVKSRKIDNYAFSELGSLKSVTILSGTAKIGTGCFMGCRKLTQLTLPNSVSSIGSAAFEDCGMSKVHIPSSLKSLGYNVFDGCKKIQKFEGGTGAKYRVVDGVLYNSDRSVLIKYPAKKDTKQFTAPSSVKRVRERAFEYASNLTELEFGSKLNSLGYCAISEADKLKSIVINSKKLYSGYSRAVSKCNRLAVIVGPNTYAMRALASSANATLIIL